MLLSVLDGAGIERVVIAGHSMGGPIALELARRAPHRVQRVVLVAGTVQSFQATLGRRRWPWRTATATACATLAEVASTSLPLPPLLRRVLKETTLGRRIALWPFVQHPARLNARDAGVLIDGVPAAGALPTAAVLGRAYQSAYRPISPTIPIDAINAREDRIAPLRDLDRFPLPLDRVAVAPGGHMLTLEAPAALTSFLHEARSRANELAAAGQDVRIGGGEGVAGEGAGASGQARVLRSALLGSARSARPDGRALARIRSTIIAASISGASVRLSSSPSPKPATTIAPTMSAASASAVTVSSRPEASSRPPASSRTPTTITATPGAGSP